MHQQKRRGPLTFSKYCLFIIGIKKYYYNIIIYQNNYYCRCCSYSQLNMSLFYQFRKNIFSHKVNNHRDYHRFHFYSLKFIFHIHIYVHIIKHCQSHFENKTSIRIILHTLILNTSPVSSFPLFVQHGCPIMPFLCKNFESNFKN